MASHESAEVRACEQQILAVEGPYHVEGVYYANAADADRQRRWLAERIARTAARREAWAKCAGVPTPAPRPRVATWITPHERQQVDVAAGARVSLAHRDSLAAVREAIATGAADAALISVALVRPAILHSLAGLVRGLPASLIVGLVADADDAQAIAGTLLLGQAGVATVIDSRAPGGWAAVRSAFDAQHLPDAFMRAALAAIVVDLAGEQHEGPHTPDAAGDVALVPDGCLRFLRAVFAPDIRSVKQLAARLAVLPSTLMSRFFRVGLPSPKRYVSYARLIWAAHLAESPAMTVSAIAYRLDASSPQSFGRSVRIVTGMTAVQFRRAVTGQVMLDHFRAVLIAPYRDTLRTFDPLCERRAGRGSEAIHGSDESAGPAQVIPHTASRSDGRAA